MKESSSIWPLSDPRHRSRDGLRCWQRKQIGRNSFNLRSSWSHLWHGDFQRLVCPRYSTMGIRTFGPIFWVKFCIYHFTMGGDYGSPGAFSHRRSWTNRWGATPHLKFEGKQITTSKWKPTSSPKMGAWPPSVRPTLNTCTGTCASNSPTTPSTAAISGWVTLFKWHH